VSAGKERGVLFYAGSAGLLAMMVVETLAVLGRRVGAPFTGALELAQVAIVPAACAAMLIATLRGSHATVHVLRSRLPARARVPFERACSIFAGVFFAAVCAGSAWLAGENWNAFEQTEVLHIPFWPLRLLATAAAGALASIFLLRAFRKREAS
jgi:TRAP-type C4-dicarboxylate transport system permease small subunit